MTELLETQGVEVPQGTVPPAVARASASTLEAVWKLLRLQRQPPVTRLAYWLAALETTIDISKARAQLGYEPVRSVADGMAELRAAGQTKTEDG